MLISINKTFTPSKNQTCLSLEASLFVRSTPGRLRNSLIFSSMLLFVVGGFNARTSAKQEQERKEHIAVAPPNTIEVGSALGGAYFVDAELAQAAEKLRAQIVEARQEKKDADEAILEQLEADLKHINTQIEQKKQLVATIKAHRKSVEQIIDLGEKKRVIFTSDNVRIRKWKGPGIKCVLEKIILADEEPKPEEFDQINLIHKLGSAESLVGKTLEQQEEDNRNYLETENGKQLTSDDILFREQMRANSHRKYSPFQGIDCNSLELDGLRKGNQSISMKIVLPGGGATHFSQRKRQANLTVYLPTCEWVAVLGCMEKVDIIGLNSNLVLTTDSSHNRNYDGSFEVRGVNGNVVIDQVPIRKLTNVSGDVDFLATNEFVNSGTMHRNNNRHARHDATATTQLSTINGNVDAWFLRTNLRLSKIKGSLDIKNEFGDTWLNLDECLDEEKAHRVLTESGLIEVVGDVAEFKRIPLYANTLCGSISTNLDDELLDDNSISYKALGHPERSWSGMSFPENGVRHHSWQRPAAALDGNERQAALDLISRGGSIRILKD